MFVRPPLPRRLRASRRAERPATSRASLAAEQLELREQPSAGALLFAAADDANPLILPGLGGWTSGAVVRFADPNLVLEPAGTTGTFSALTNLDVFGDGDVRITALHYVRRQVTVGA